VDALTIYQAYPRHRGKRAALTAIRRALARLAPEHDADWLLLKVNEYAQERLGEDEHFTPHPATWFNQDRFFDEPPARFRLAKEPDDTEAYLIWESMSDGFRKANPWIGDRP
jgi:hypothetical protein